jgi:hypothetical protein
MRPPGDAPSGRERAHDGQRRHALAAAGFDDDRQRLSGAHRERQVIDHLDDAPPGRELDRQVIDVEQCLHLRAASSSVAFVGCITAAQARVQRIVQPVADQADAEHGEEDSGCRQRRRPPRLQDDSAAGADHQPPAHHVCVGESQERQAGSNSTAVADRERRGDQDRRTAFGKSRAAR